MVVEFAMKSCCRLMESHRRSSDAVGMLHGGEMSRRGSWCGGVHWSAVVKRRSGGLVGGSNFGQMIMNF